MFFYPIVSIQSRAETVDPITTQPTAKNKTSSHWAVMPVIARAEETDWQFGALLMHLLPMVSVENKQSRVLAVAFYTTNNQYLLSAAPNIYTLNGKYTINAGITYRFWPANYYGIGNNTPDQAMKYEAKQQQFNIHMERHLKNKYRAGIGLRYSKESIHFKETNIHDSSLTGATGGTAMGLGFSLAHDTRDDIDAAYRGHLFSYKPYFYQTSWKSDFTYQTHEIDLRKYVQTGKQSTFGFAAYFRSSTGNIPFRELSTPDGITKLRGIELGRYRDKYLFSTQFEYRFPIAARFGFTVFAESAQVAHQFADFHPSEFKYSVGSGIRWQMIPSKRFNLRADFSYVDTGFGFVINVGEAF